MAMTNISLHINDEFHEVDVDPATPLLFVLRNKLGLTGTKFGCGLEQCGSCAVLVDGCSTLTCSAAVTNFAGKQITTIEGLANGENLSRVQQAFLDAGASQCGYCIPGLIIAVTSMLEVTPSPDDDAIETALAPHLCRCGSHGRIMAAIDSLIGRVGVS